MQLSSKSLFIYSSSSIRYETMIIYKSAAEAMHAWTSVHCGCMVVLYQMIAFPWWRYETFSALLAICAEISLVTGEFLSQRPVTRNFDVFFDLRLNIRLSKHSRGWWLETPSYSLWRHSNVWHVIRCSLKREWNINCFFEELCTRCAQYCVFLWLGNAYFIHILMVYLAVAVYIEHLIDTPIVEKYYVSVK